MASLNKVELIGRLGKDPEVRNLQNGQVANFSVATSETWKDRDGERQERTEWHNITVWNEKTIEFVDKYLKKGDMVRLEGKIQSRKYDDKDGNERTAFEIVIPKFAPIDALMKLSYDNDNSNGGGNSRGSSRSNSRDRDDDRGGDNRGSSSSRSSRSRDDDRGGRDDDRGGSRASSRSSRRDDRDDRGGDDRGGSRGGNGGGRGRDNNDMDDDIPF
ncbi:single-stranded DNA-binding protein [Bradyrhizobium diazoefficiens]|nr:hypothetical protein XF16B_45270 [Bradyrhizobium diazoefficiens]BCF70180.1 hypothetical protein XF19B_45330 [Bradyrhizobium diazoefficiens]